MTETEEIAQLTALSADHGHVGYLLEPITASHMRRKCECRLLVTWERVNALIRVPRFVI